MILGIYDYLLKFENDEKKLAIYSFIFIFAFFLYSGIIEYSYEISEISLLVVGGLNLMYLDKQCTQILKMNFFIHHKYTIIYAAIYFFIIRNFTSFNTFLISTILPSVAQCIGNFKNKFMILYFFYSTLVILLYFFY